MQLIVGLGNPGPEYLLTRHNIGFMAADALAQRHSGHFKNEHKALVTKIRIGSHQALLAKPQTYMNRSGQSVRALLDYYDIGQDHLLVLHDDIDQAYQALRYQKNRGHGGHNGIRDIHKILGNNEYHRLKLGVDRPSNPGFEVADYVLQNFSKSEQAELPDFLGLICDSLETYIESGFEKAANQYNQSGKGKS